MPNEVKPPAGEVLVYQSEDGRTKLDVRLDDQTVWLNQKETGLANVFEMLDQRDPDRAIPVMVSHGACKVGDGKPGYNLTDRWVGRIAERRGVIGVILCDHYMTQGSGRDRPKTIIEPVDTVCWHIDRIREVTGSFDNIGFRTDYDGFIKPVLTGLERPSALALLERALIERYGQDNSDRFAAATR